MAFGKRAPGEAVAAAPNERTGRAAEQLEREVAERTEAGFERLAERRGGDLSGISIADYEALRRAARGAAEDAVHSQASDDDWRWSASRRRFIRRKPLGLLAALVGSALWMASEVAADWSADWLRCALGLSSACAAPSARAAPSRGGLLR